MQRITPNKLLFNIVLFTALFLSGMGAAFAEMRPGDVISLCHREATKPPYTIQTVTIDENGRHGHEGSSHGGDVIPAPAAGCPNDASGTSTTGTPEPVTMLLLGAGLVGVGYITRRAGRQYN